MKMKILDLRPTQMALGLNEVEYRVKKLRDMKAGERDTYLHDRRVPIVIGDRSRIYIVDHHHLVRSCWEVGLEEVPVEQKADLSHLSRKEFWIAMHASHWIYPFDQFGSGPHDPELLPENIKGLADDPFRSLAWIVRENGGYQKTGIPFSEFQWAHFFRKNMKIHPVAESFTEAVKEAMKLARSQLASHLPGHL